MLARNRAWQANNRERMSATRKRYLQTHTPPSRNRPRMTLYTAAWREAKRLRIDPGLHWWRWITGTLPA